MSIQDLTASLDLKQNLNIYATCKQFDSLNLILSIYDNSLQADLTNYDIRLRAMKSDQVPLIQEHIGITIFSNIATIEADEQLTTTSGKTLIELQFINKTTGKKKATFNLVLKVVPSTLEINATISTATYTLLQELKNKLDQCSDFFENIDEAITANTNLENSTNTANLTKEALDNTNTAALETKSDLDTSNTNATNTKEALDLSITNANASKEALDTSKNNADASKVALDSSIEAANNFAETHQDIENLVNQVNSNTTQLSDIPNQTYITEKAKTTEVNNALELKADKTALDTTNAEVSLKANKSEVTNVMTPKGNVTYASLPTTGNSVGNYYYCSDGDGTHGSGNYVWNGTAWYFGGTGDQGYNLVMGEVEELESELFILKNRVLSSVAGYYLTTTVGQQVQQVANSAYSYAKAEVKGGKYYTTSISPSTSFSVVTDKNNIIIGLLSAYKTSDSGYVYLMPSNAAYIYVCKNVNPLTNIVVFKGRTDIATIPLSVINYPFNTIVGISSNQMSVSNDFSDSKTVRQEIDDINDKLDNTNTIISKVDSAFTFYEVSEPVFDNTSSFSFVASSTNFIGFGLRIIAPKKIRKINAYFLSDNSGTGYCQIVDTNNNIIATKSTTISASNSGTTEFDFGEIDLSSYNEVWVRFYGDGTAKPRRATHDLSSIVSSEVNKYMYMNSSAQWVVSSSGGYSIPFICITGYSESNTKRVFYCGSTREYTKLKDAIEEAVKYMDSTVYVDAEDFDLVQEFGLAYLNAYDGSRGNIGIFLKNRVHVIFASGARVLFNYTGGNTNTETYFSPFNSGEYGFTLENAWVEDTNSRYSMHDERNSASDPYHNIYKRCTFIHDSSTSSWGVHQALGGGLGLHGDILMEDCYAKTVGGGECISWHNATADAVSCSRIVVRNCYLEGTFRVSNYGTSTVKSRAYCNGCSLLYEPYLTHNDGQADNMELYSWNNVIRS